MLPRKELLVSFCLVTLATCGVVKGPAGSGWAGFGPKSVYSRALGPPASGMSTISVPYMPKSPFFPKFVDPKMMIAKKTDMLGNLFGGLGPAAMGPAAMGPDFKPIMPYGVSGAPMYSVGDAKDAFVGKPTEYLTEDTAKTNAAGLYKRGIFGPFGGKFGGAGPKFGPAGAKFGPMGPMGPFGPMAQFGPSAPFEGPEMVPDYSMKDAFSRKRRSIEPSPVANLQAIMDNKEPEVESNKVVKAVADDAATPTEFMPGMFGPFGPVVDPSMFIAKKTTFLDTLFKSLATSTTPPPVDTTDIPVPKSTIVPPDFWFPSSMIPSPTEYNDKVAGFLDKLFDSLKLNKTASADTAADDSMALKTDTMRSVKPEVDAVESRIARSSADLSSINAAKDTIVNSIMSELGDLKSDMMTTMNDLITYEKTASAAAMPPKKPFKPFAMGPWAKPAADVTLPFKQRMMALSQVFDMLTDLQKNITQSIQEAVLANTKPAEQTEVQTEASYPQMPAEVYSTGSYPFNATLLDALKSKLSALDVATPAPFAYNAAQVEPKKVRTLPASPASFWVSYPEGGAAAYKREAGEEMIPILASEENNAGHQNQKQYARGVKMQMHQGYQSLPAGSVESVQAGGGSVPGHQGGGIKLFDSNTYQDMDKWVDWMEYVKNEQQGRRHSHNHH